MDIGASGGTVRAFGLVRDKDGNPKVDDVSTLPQEIIDQLSASDKQYLGITDKKET